MSNFETKIGQKIERLEGNYLNLNERIDKMEQAK